MARRPYVPPTQTDPNQTPVDPNQMTDPNAGAGGASTDQYGNATSTPEMSAFGIPMDKLQKVFALTALMNPKSASTLNTVMGMAKLAPPTAAEQKDKLAKTNADRIITQMENSYMKNKLYYGTGLKGTLAELTYPLSNTPFGNPNDPYAQWRSQLESMGPYLAKAAGDAGNIALQEQIKALKPFPNARTNRQTAIQKFNDIRSKFGLPTRTYTDSTNPTGGYAPTGLQDLGSQFTGQ